MDAEKGAIGAVPCIVMVHVGFAPEPPEQLPRDMRSPRDASVLVRMDNGVVCEHPLECPLPLYVQLQAPFMMPRTNPRTIDVNICLMCDGVAWGTTRQVVTTSRKLALAPVAANRIGDLQGQYRRVLGEHAAFQRKDELARVAQSAEIHKLKRHLDRCCKTPECVRARTPERRRQHILGYGEEGDTYTGAWSSFHAELQAADAAGRQRCDATPDDGRGMCVAGGVATGVHTVPQSSVVDPCGDETGFVANLVHAQMHAL